MRGSVSTPLRERRAGPRGWSCWISTDDWSGASPCPGRGSLARARLAGGKGSWSRFRAATRQARRLAAVQGMDRAPSLDGYFLVIVQIEIHPKGALEPNLAVRHTPPAILNQAQLASVVTPPAPRLWGKGGFGGGDRRRLANSARTGGQGAPLFPSRECHQQRTLCSFVQINLVEKAPTSKPATTHRAGTNNRPTTNRPSLPCRSRPRTALLHLADKSSQPGSCFWPSHLPPPFRTG